MKTSILILFIGLAAAGCARAAPSLPSAQTIAPVQMEAAERLAACTAIDEQLATSQQRTAELDAIIHSNRRSNQAIGYVAAITLPPLMLAAEENSAEKAELDRLQAERDQLYAKRRAAAC